MSNQTILDSALAHVRAEDAPAYRPAKKTLRQKIGYWRFKLKSYLVSRSLQRAGVEGWIHVPTERPGMAVLDGGRLSFGRNCTVRSFRSQLTSLCAMGGQIVIGDDCLINSGVVMVAEKGFTIAVGENARIANEVSIQTSHYHAVHRGAPVKTGDVRIGRNVWIGMRSVVSPGVSIGDGAIVGAMSFVSKDIPAFEMWGGVPARKIRDLPRDPDWKRA